MKHPIRIVAALSLLLAVGPGGPREARAYEVSERLEVYGYFQSWFTVVEQMEEARGLQQIHTDDPASTWTTGFRMQRLRLGLNARFLDDALEAVLLLRLEGDPGMMDVYVRWRPLRWLSVLLGQFRIPSTAENLRPDRDLPFLQRTHLSDALADYSLSRTNYSSSLFSGNRSLRRDFGLGVRIDQVWPSFGIHVHAMIGNGLGANLFISGDRQRGFLIANEGQLYYAGRLALDLVPGWLTVGGHGSYNRHDDVVFNSGRTVLDLDRWSASGDVILRVAAWGLTVGALGGYGEVREDANFDDRRDYEYGGVAGYVLWDLQPLLTHVTRGRFGRRHHLVLGARFEWFFDVSDEAPETTHEYQTTVSLGYRCGEHVRLQLDAMLRRLDEPFMPDLDDDAFILGAQFAL
jgi:hypothetical protein